MPNPYRDEQGRYCSKNEITILCHVVGKSPEQVLGTFLLQSTVKGQQ